MLKDTLCSAPILKIWAGIPTSTPRPNKGICLNTSDSTHNRGKANIVDSFASNQVQLDTQRILSKGGKVKISQGAQARNHLN